MFRSEPIFFGILCSLGLLTSGPSTWAANTGSASDGATVQSCTDSSGMTYFRGKPGFDTCIQVMNQMKASKTQMPGTKAGLQDEAQSEGLSGGMAPDEKPGHPSESGVGNTPSSSGLQP